MYRSGVPDSPDVEEVVEVASPRSWIWRRLGGRIAEAAYQNN
jgi:hypothetical protein